jgi:Domain of unknown function (DUF4249)
MKKIILFISFFILFLACREKEIEYELPFEGEKLVVIGVLNPDESFNVKVSHTWTPTGIVPKNTFVNDATVIVLENGKLREQLMLDKEGKYVSSKGLKPLLGQKYSVEVSSSKYAKVTINTIEILPKTRLMSLLKMIFLRGHTLLSVLIYTVTFPLMEISIIGLVHFI